MALVKHKYIQDRATFFDALDKGIADSRRLGGAPPGFAPLETILYQLEMIKVWTANGRKPTKDERRSITMGMTVVRELEPAPTDDLFRYTELIHELSFYFKLWWDDAEWAAMDDKDPRLSFPDDGP
ncbi:MAG TPA: hypothetical protein VGL81_16600 [Polyangiaceae bacterium]|jgi:hypothetical protein